MRFLVQAELGIHLQGEKEGRASQSILRLRRMEQVASPKKFHWNLQREMVPEVSLLLLPGESHLQRKGEEAGLKMELQKTLPLGPHPKVLRRVAVELQDLPLESLP